MASILRATPCASGPSGPQRRQRQGRSSASGCSLTRSTRRYLCARPEHDDRLPPKRRDISTAHTLPLFLSILSKTDVNESALALGWWPHITRGVSTTAPGAPSGSWSRLHGRRTTIPFALATRCVSQACQGGQVRWAGSGRAGGPRSPLAAGKMWEFLSLGGKGSSPRLLPIPFFCEQKDSHWRRMAWLGLGGRSSPRLGHIWARTLVPPALSAITVPNTRSLLSNSTF